MASNRKKPERPRRRAAYTLYARIDPSIGEALERYLLQVRPKTNRQAVTELALERLLTEAGLLPLPKEADAS